MAYAACSAVHLQSGPLEVRKMTRGRHFRKEKKKKKTRCGLGDTWQTVRGRPTNKHITLFKDDSRCENNSLTALLFSGQCAHTKGSRPTSPATMVCLRRDKRLGCIYHNECVSFLDRVFSLTKPEIPRCKSFGMALQDQRERPRTWLLQRRCHHRLQT